MTSADYVCLLCMKETAIPHQYPCPHCGGDDRTLVLQSPALPPRTVLDNRYVLGRTLGQGGFGITYMAYDLRMGNTVAVKEYFPSSLVGRDSSVSSNVTVNAIKGTRAREEYASGLRHFLYEARRQAKLASSPGVVSVTDFFEGNNTAYYIMEYVDGSTLVRYLKKPIPIDEVLHLLEPIADSLMSIHDAELIHRDISPDNIMCARNGQRKLLDFGASHSFAEEESTTGNATLKHGFAPPEQYGSSSMQGPWTDVYAFAATVYWCLTGKIPQDSMDRSIGGDRLKPPSELGAAITPDAEAVLMRGMALPVTARYQDMVTFWGKMKRAVANSSQRAAQRGVAAADLGGKTTVVPKISRDEEPEMERPEITRVPEKSMDRPGGSKRKSNFPVSARNLSFAPVEELEEMQTPESTTPAESRSLPEPPSASEDAEEPDITIYRPNLSSIARKKPISFAAPIEDEEEETPEEEKKPVIIQEPVPAEAPVEPSSSHSHNKLVFVLVALVAVLAVAFAWAVTHPKVQSEPDTSEVVENVTIGGSQYPLDATELYFIGSGNYTPFNRKGVEYVQLDYLSASDWRTICSMSNLHRLSLVGLELNDLSGIENLPYLEILDVSGNELSTLEPLTKCVSLNELYAADNRLESCPQLPGVVYLDLSGNRISSVTDLAKLSRLKSLYLHRNNISDASPLGELSSLATLDLAHNNIHDLNHLNQLSALKMLYVDGNYLSNDVLTGFHNDVPNCALDVDFLTDIPDEVQIGKNSYSTSLTKLSIPSSQLEDKDIQNLKYMVNLTELELEGNNITDITPISRLYGLNTLVLSHNKIEDISCLSGLYQLNALYLSSNRISDLSPVSALTQLETLAIGNNSYDDISPLSALTSMRTLVMCDCGWQDLSALFTMKELFELRISEGVYDQWELNDLKTAVPSVHINQYS